MKIAFLSALLWALHLVGATRQLKAHALVPCSNSNAITSKDLSILYDHPSRTVYYNASVQISFSGEVYADIEVWIYGLKAITATLNPCAKNTNLKQLCPVNAGSIDIQSNSVLSESITKKIPGVAFTVPDIDAYVIAKVRNMTTAEEIACLNVQILNTKTVEQTAVKWVTAVLGGIGFLVSALLVFLGTSVDSHNISAVTVLMLGYYQSVAFVGMTAVERVPPIASAWCENIAWSVGLVYSAFLEKIFRWYIQSTGGDPKTYKLYPTTAVLVQKLRRRAVDGLANVSPRSLDYLRNMKTEFFTPEGGVVRAASALVRRRTSGAEEAYARSSSNLVVYRGIERVAYKMGIEVTSAVITTYTIFIFICVCVVFIFFMTWLLLHFITKSERYNQDQLNEKSENMSADGMVPDNISTTFTSYEGPLSRSLYFFHLLPSLLKGTLLKLWYVAFGPVVLFSMWEWTHNDSAAVIVVSVFMFVVCIVILASNIWRVYIIARKSKQETGTPAYLLYADPKVLQKYGYLYSMFDVKYYFFGLVYMAYTFVKACFLAFGQDSGQTQALALFIIELFMFIAIAHLKPFLSKAVNGIVITSHVVMTLNAVFFLFFSNLMTQPLIVNGVMGVIFFILNAAFSLVLLLYIIIYSTLCIIWHKRQGARVDHHVNDDRNSFILDRQGRTAQDVDELQALGKAAQADHNADLTAESSAWFQGGPTHTTPFEPTLYPPTPQLRGERHSNVFSDSRAQTMTSEMSGMRDGQLLDFSPSHHKVNESQASFEISRFDGSSSPESERPRAKRGFKNFFRKR
nr:Flc3 [Starmerella bombicola]